MKKYEITIGNTELETLKESVELAINVLKMENGKIAEYLNLDSTGLSILEKLKIKLFGSKNTEDFFTKEIEKKYQILKILNSKLS